MAAPRRLVAICGQSALRLSGPGLVKIPAALSPSTLLPAYIQPQCAPRQSISPRQDKALCRAGRWYSVGSSKGKGSDDDAAVPGSRIWSFDEVKKLVERQKGQPQDNVVLVDVREPAELQTTGKIPGAVNIPMTKAARSFYTEDADFRDVFGFDRPERSKTLLFYCKAGVRAKTAAGLAKQAGWHDVAEYTGSWLDWEANGGPVESVKSRGDST